MTRILLFILFGLMGSSVMAQQQYQGLLWQITGNGLTEASYLYGTMHVSNKVAFHLSDSFFKAIESVDVVALEINPETWMETMTHDPYVADKMGGMFVRQGGDRRNGFYRSMFEIEAPDQKKVGDLLSSDMEILNSLLYRTNSFNAEFQEETYLDLFIFQAGKKQGKEITGLEHLGTTMRLGDEAAVQEEDREKIKLNRELTEERRHILTKMLDGKSYSESLEDAYRKGDLNWLDSLSRLSGQNNKYHDLMIVKRNIGMANAMDSIMQEKSLFAGVGAAHLPNTYGVIELLRSKGYTVRPVDPTITDFGREKKEQIEDLNLKQKYQIDTTFDQRMALRLPGPLYEFPESDHVMMAAYPEMVNGATYVITRFQTYAPLFGLSPQALIERVDSVLFENIPGKIIERSQTQRYGYPALDVTNRTKRGDLQRYQIVVTPIEIIIFKVGGRKDYVADRNVAAFFDNIKFIHGAGWSTFNQRNNAFTVEMPGSHVYEPENNEFHGGFWNKTVQSHDPSTGYFMLMSRSYSDFSFIEEDSFEVHQFASQFIDHIQYEMDTAVSGDYHGRSMFTCTASKDNLPLLHVRCIASGRFYYLLVAQSDDDAAVERYFNSFEINPFRYERKSVVQHDSLRKFKVQTSVQPPPDYQYYNAYSLDDEDDSYEEKEKSAVYYNIESDEAIYVRYKRFHRYYTQPHIDSIWNKEVEDFTENGKFILTHKRSWQDSNTYFCEMAVSDTNSVRKMISKYIVKDGAMYSLYNETDSFLNTSSYVKEFFETFEPFDTSFGDPVIGSKSKKFLSDLYSSDSLTREAATNSFDIVQFDRSDVPALIDAYQRQNGGEYATYVRGQLIRKLGQFNHPEVLPFLESTYNALGDSASLQLAVLKAMVDQKNKKATRLALDLIMENTPLTGSDEYHINQLFFALQDSLELAVEWYPKVIRLTLLSEYKQGVYDLMAQLREEHLLSKFRYRRHLNQMVWEANNEVKRQKSKESNKGKNFLTKSSRSQLYHSYDPLLLDYAKLLIPYSRKSKVKDHFARLELLNNPGLRLDIAVLKLENDKSLPPDFNERVMENVDEMAEWYIRLQGIDRTDLFPEVTDRQRMVRSMFSALAYINTLKDSLVELRNDTVQLKDGAYWVTYFKIKHSYDDDWEYGYIALPENSTNWSPYANDVMSNVDFRFNKFEDADLQLDRQSRKLEMAHHLRYRVDDEERFRDLSLKSGRYGF